MLQVSEAFNQAMIAPVRQFVAEVALQENAANPASLTNYTHEDKIKSFEIQRVGDSTKFFGFGVCQKLSLKLVDLADEVEPISNSKIKVKVGIVLDDGSVEHVNYPTFYLTEKNKSEDSGEVSLTAYDITHQLSSYSVADLQIETPYTIRGFVSAAANLLGVPLVVEGVDADDYAFSLSYDEGANFDGSENLRDALNAAAEATQTIYFINSDDELCFKRLDVSGEAVATITAENYITLSHSGNRRLVEVAHVTELGDNVSVEPTISGTTQYVRDNPFWELRDDIATIVENATANVYGLTVHQFESKWRGFPPLEVGDKFELEQVAANGYVDNSYLLDDVVYYDGGFSQTTRWKYENSDLETATNPSSLGDVLNQTTAKVDKVNKEISLVVSEVDSFSSDISALVMNSESITQSVQNIQKQTEESLKEITTKVEQTMTPEEVSILISQSIKDADNPDSVTTSTGYTFDADGLTVSKSGSEMSTQITEDGMVVNRDGSAVLVADNEGVTAEDLHATTYLIIGHYSRFQDFDDSDFGSSTGCFWLGDA